LNSVQIAPQDSVSRKIEKKQNPEINRSSSSVNTDRLSAVPTDPKGPIAIDEKVIQPEDVLAGSSTSENKKPEKLAQNLNTNEELFSLLQRRELEILPVNIASELMLYPANRNNSQGNGIGDDLFGLSDFKPEPEKKKSHHWILGSEFAPLYSYRSIASDYLNPDALKDLNESESGIISYAGGIRIAFAASKRLSVQSGIYYSRYGQEKNDVYVYNPANVDNISGSLNQAYLAVSNSTGIITSTNPAESGYDKIISNIPGNSADANFYSGFTRLSYADPNPVPGSDITATQYFDYLEVPVTLKYKIIDRKFDFSIHGGFITNFLVGNKITLNQNGDSQDFGKTSDITQVNYLGSVGLGFEYPLVSNFTISLEPRFRYYLNPLDNSSQINVHPYSLGFFAGISYFF
jgi:hypothetical protein